MIKDLKNGQIFVFGSNLAGRHGRGAAKLALDKFGAVYGHGEGLQGRSYAFPTLDGRLEKLSTAELTASIVNFLECAQTHPQLTFLLTKVGCGLAGYSEAYVTDLFSQFDFPDNVVFPEDWA